MAIAKFGSLERPSSKILRLNENGLKNSLPDALKPSPPPGQVKAIKDASSISASDSGKVFNFQGSKID